MAAPDFYGPNLKVERAKHHIDSLETIFEQFISHNIKRLRLKRDNRFLEREGAASRLFPKHTPTVLGDALHNLKSALDHAYCIMVEENERTVTKHTLFPFGKDRKSLEGSINGQKLERLTPSDAIIDVILNEIQPYEYGKLGLYGLHLLDITDKHHVLIPTTANMVIREPTELLDEFGQETGYSFSGMTLSIQQNQKTAYADFIGGGGAILQGNPKNAFDIAFDKGQPFERESILKTVNTLHTNVVEALNLILKAS
jgi:hypothetical protein